MTVFRRILFVAAAAGLLASVFATALHMVGTARLIQKAEGYEKAGEISAAPAAHAASRPAMGSAPAHQHEESAWEPADGFERTAFTALADILTGIGFALLLVSVFVLRGREVDWRTGLFWGLAGFATFTLAPGLGLPPEVPGTEAAPLLHRQIWWVATATATAGGLALLFLTQRARFALAGIALLVLPHLVGAPQPAEYRSLAPELLAHQFVVAAVVTSLLFWLALGSLTGFFYKRSQGASPTE
ncbi:MAG: CbtA family protein [Alphaproteobacteria bacterium]